jgi:hypothetical protein
MSEPALVPFAEIIVPFAEKECISVRRAARILGVSVFTVERLTKLKNPQGRPLLALASYRRYAHKRVLYSSLVNFCCELRARYGIEDRWPPLASPLFRHREEDLLPFPLTDTISSAEALAALGYVNLRCLTDLIEEGKFDAYRLTPEGTWRISRSSFATFLVLALCSDPNRLIRTS